MHNVSDNLPKQGRGKEKVVKLFAVVFVVLFLKRKGFGLFIFVLSSVLPVFVSRVSKGEATYVCRCHIPCLG